MLEANYLGTTTLKWPYEIAWQKRSLIETDILVIGGGLAGSFAAIEATKAGLRVAVVDKAPIKASGDGGAGIDHWVNCFSSPASPVTPEDYMELPGKHTFLGHLTYLATKGTYDTLLELEKMGLPIRDDGTFQNSPFYEKETGLLRAYDYTQTVGYKLRGGHHIKKILYRELCLQQNISLHERIMITTLLNKDGRQESAVVGAMGVSMTTGELFLFQAKAVVLTTGGVTGTWIFNTELCANSFRNDPNNVGDGLVLAWKAGARLVQMQNGGSTHGGHPFSWPRYGAGTCDNTWFPCPMVDNNGKKIPWVDGNGKPITTYEERCAPAEGQPYINTCMDKADNIHKPLLIHDLPERIKQGEFELPLWADLTDLPESERKSIWGLMIGNKGKTRYPIYAYYNASGFDPSKDMLQAPIMAVDSYYNRSLDWFHGEPDTVRQWRTEDFGGTGAVACDWNLMTNVEGLFCAGNVCGLNGASYSCASGRFVGKTAARYAKKQRHEALPELQIAKEEERIYAPLVRFGNPDAVISWKEMWAGTARVMQCCFTDNKAGSVVQFGIDWLQDIMENEMQQLYARNPHELVRALECETRACVGQLYMKAYLAFQRRKAQADYREDEILFLQEQQGQATAIIKEAGFWLKAPYAKTYLENYQSCLKDEAYL